MSMLYVYIASAVQVVAESFPISSSGHCKFLEALWERATSLKPLLQLAAPWSDNLFFERFIDLLHIVPLVIIAVYFYQRWRIFILYPERVWRTAIKLVIYAALADAVTGLFYLVRDNSFFANLPLWVGFALTTVALFTLAVLPEGKARLTIVRAIILGVFQGVALLVPGLSRFAATFCGARVLGFSSRSALKVSCMIQWPLILAAAARSAFFFVRGSHSALMVPMLWLVVGCSTIIAWYGFVFSVRLAVSGRLWLFGFYTVLITLASALFAY